MIPPTSTAVAPIVYACPACGNDAHPGGVSACPDVKEAEFDKFGHVTRIVKR